MQVSLAPHAPHAPQAVSLRASAQLISAKQRKRISLTETYCVATTCRSKLGKEAGRKDHELRRLVGHANMLDMLMEELMEAEREQEGRVNALIRAAPKPQQPPKVQWIDTIAEELEEDDSDSDEDSDDDGDLGGYENRKLPVRTAKIPLPKLSSAYFDDSDELSDDDDEADEGPDDSELVLRRWPSKHHLPELTYDSDSASEDEDSLSSFLDDTYVTCFDAQCLIINKKSPQDGLNIHTAAKALAPTVFVH